MSNKIESLKDLAVNHRYYCSDSNFYSNDAAASYDTWEDFIEEMEESDMDYNLCFRFDIKQREEEDESGQTSVIGSYWGEVFMMQQRKGKFVPIAIHELKETDLPSILAWLTPRWEYLKSLWQPIS